MAESRTRSVEQLIRQTGGQYLIASRDVYFRYGRSGHYKRCPVLERICGQGEDNDMDRISSRTPSRTGARNEAGAGTSSGARDRSQSGGRFTARQHSVMAAGEEDGSSRIHEWKIGVPSSVEIRLRVGSGFEVKFLLGTEIHVPQAVTPMEAAPDIYSLSIERKSSRKYVDQDPVTVHKDVTVGVKSEVTKGKTINYA